MPSRAIVGPSVSVVLFLLSESIDGGDKRQKKYALTRAFRAEREGEGEGSVGDCVARLSLAFNWCQQQTGHEGPEQPWN